MEINKVKSRSVVFRQKADGWFYNIHLIQGSRRNYLIDTGLGSLSVAPVLDYLRGAQKPLVVINTHYHWDHIWGNHVFDGGVIISHRLCREMTVEKWNDMLKKNGGFVRGETRLRLPDTVFDGALYFPDDQIRLFHTPGHTADSISLLDEADGVLNVGDNIGDTTDDIVPSVAAGKDVYLSTLALYMKTDFDTCVSGHNVTLGKEVLNAVLKAYPLSEGSF